MTLAAVPVVSRAEDQVAQEAQSEAHRGQWPEGSGRNSETAGRLLGKKKKKSSSADYVSAEPPECAASVKQQEMQNMGEGERGWERAVIGCQEPKTPQVFVIAAWELFLFFLKG